MSFRSGERGEGTSARRLLLPFAIAYGGLAALNRWSYAVGLRPRLGVAGPVVSVGGVSLGGSGKTPVTLYLARLVDRVWGLKVGVVHSGYGGRAGHRVQRVIVESSRDGRWFGDEAVLLAQRLPGAVVVRGPDKAAAARRCLQEGARLVVLDDGLQHLRLRRDLDILVRSRPADWPVPAGNGREFDALAGRADLTWWHDRSGYLGVSTAGAFLGRVEADVVSTLVPSGLVTPTGDAVGQGPALANARVHLIAGIAEPSAFRDLVQRCGAKVVGTTFVRDHRVPSGRTLARAVRRGADLLLCTEKDAARFPELLSDVGALALRCETRILRGADVIERALERVLESSLGDGVSLVRAGDRGVPPFAEGHRGPGPSAR